MKILISRITLAVALILSLIIFENFARADAPIWSEYLQRNYLAGPIQIQPDLKNQNHLVVTGRLGGSVCVEKQNSFKIEEGPIGGIDPAVEPFLIFPSKGLHEELIYPDFACDSPNLFTPQGVGKLPSICPRMASARYLYGIDTSLDPNTVSNPEIDYYDGAWDTKNNPPKDIFQAPGSIRPKFDCQKDDILKIDRVSTTYDWEDAGELIGINGDGQEVYEITGGAYANFHYAVMPCDPFYKNQNEIFLKYVRSLSTNEQDLNLLESDPDIISVERRSPMKQAGDLARKVSHLARCANQTCSDDEYKAYRAMQYLLHLAEHGLNNQGKWDLYEIGETSNIPSLKLHSLLPGAFWTKNDNGYDQCEWFDSHLAPRQTVRYANFGIWDWSNVSSCVDVILWEGDSAQTPLARGEHFGPLGILKGAEALIGPTDIADDFIGFFHVEKDPTEGPFLPLRLTNFSGDLTIDFSTGRSDGCRSQ